MPELSSVSFDATEGAILSIIALTMSCSSFSRGSESSVVSVLTDANNPDNAVLIAFRVINKLFPLVAGIYVHRSVDV